MRKRRVLALLLALSLVMSGNGMTVLAAEQGADMPVLLSQEETLPEGDNLAESSDAETSADDDKAETTVPGDEDSEKNEVSGEEKEPTAVEEPEDTVQTEPAAPKGDEAGQEDNRGAVDEMPAEGGTSEEGDPAAATGEDSTEELPGGEEGSGLQDQEPDIDTAEDISGNHVEAPEAVAAMVLPEAQPYVSRIVTFTDDTGMRITYDANAEQQYQYVVDDNGVLTAVNTVTIDEKEETVVASVDFDGNVELKQPREGKQYTSIASGIFTKNAKITYVKLPAGVETIGTEAFKGCTSLKGIYLADGLKKIEDSAFEGCIKLSQIAVPKTVTQIGDSAFKDDAKLYMVYMKDVDYCDLKSIGGHAFEGCSSLAEFCSDTEFLVPTKVESIGEAAFKGCKAIKKIDFKQTKLAEMGKSAFQGCSGLKELSLGENLDLIPERAFSGCSVLMAVNFTNGRKDITIDKYAFADCYNLKELILPQAVVEIKDYAFQGCTELTRVEIGYDRIRLGSNAFPRKSEAPNLVIVAHDPSYGYDYARENQQLPKDGAFYTYRVEDAEGRLVQNGVFVPGGTVWVSANLPTVVDDELVIPEPDQNINKEHKGQGVPSDSEKKESERKKYYIYYKPDKGYTFDTSVLRCNGQPMQKESGQYYFTMPEGGVVITAGFLASTPDTIKGKTVTVEFSAGIPLQNGVPDEYGYRGVELKVGQTTRMFLLDEDGEIIPADKIAKIEESSKAKVVTVNKSGVITAVGTGGAEQAEARVEVTVKGGDGEPITIGRTIIVTTAEAKAITLKASGYPDSTSSVQLSGETDGVQTLDITKGYVATKGISFTLKANVYDGTEGIGKALTWKSSNDKVAKLASANTTEKDPVNVVTIPAGCQGEALITVTAKNAEASAEKAEVSQKFVIHVFQEGFSLASSTVTYNPKMIDGGTIELISSYNKEIDDTTAIKIYEKKKDGRLVLTNFMTDGGQIASNGSSKIFRIKPDGNQTIKDGKYSVWVGVNDSKEDLLPLTIIVSSKMPTPTIKFNATKAKFNLFFKDGRLTADSEPTLVTTEITKLGTTEIEDVTLEALSTKDDDKLFLDNFEIDKALTVLSEGKVVIKRKAGSLRYTSKKKPAVTGNLVIYYKGYKSSAAKKMKVTMPTCTTPPSYALRETKGVYCAKLQRDPYSETFEIYDKKSKTKEKVVLDASQYTVSQEPGQIIPASGPSIQEDGTIGISFVPEKNTKLKLVLKNDQIWDRDQNGAERTLSFNYTISVNNAKPVIKTKENAVSLNLNYTDQKESFELVSNQKDVVIYPIQEFKPVRTKSNREEIDKLDVRYIGGRGEVKIKSGQPVKKGTYKFECESPMTDWVSTTNPADSLKKVVLTVKIVDTQPTVKIGKGALQLNLAAYNSNAKTEGQETAEITYAVSGEPQGYRLAPVGTGQNDTEITCVNNNNVGAERNFNFSVSEGSQEMKTDSMIRVSLKNNTINTGTYKFKMILRYMKDGAKTVSTKPVNFNVKVYRESDISLTVTAAGKINLVNRTGEANERNGIIYTPTLKNITGEIEAVKIYDIDGAGSLDQESAYFNIKLIDEGKDAGKFFVWPKATLKPADTPVPPAEPEKPSVSGNTTEPGGSVSGNTTEPGGSVSGNTTNPGGSVSGNTTEPGGSVSGNTTNPGGSVSGNTTEPGGSVSGNTTNPDGSVSDNTANSNGTTDSGEGTKLQKPSVSDNTSTPDTPKEYEYVPLDNGKDYPVQIWVKVKGYAGTDRTKGGVMTKTIFIKTAQILPKVTTDKSLLDVYLSTKDYDATFVVKPVEGSVGAIEWVGFGEKEENAKESFTLIQTPQADGSMKVVVHLQKVVGLANNSTMTVTMNVKYKGQGINTPEAATSFTMTIHVN